MTIGYLPQDGLALRGKTVFEECLSVFDELHAMERECEEITHTHRRPPIRKSKEYAAAADRYSEIADQLHVHDIYTLDAQVGAVLGGLGFSKEDWERRTEEFSGGWQMRIALAKLLLQKPILLLLDEPTNHLDLEIAQLAGELPARLSERVHPDLARPLFSRRDGEQDRRDLEQAHARVPRQLREVRAQKEERRAQLMAAYKNQRDRIEALEVFINRFRYQATKAKQVQSRIKELEKIERIEVPRGRGDHPLHFPQPPPAAERWSKSTDVCPMHYGEKRVLENVSFTIERGDRIALVGVNGAGKSTLIRMLSRQETPTKGDDSSGHNVLSGLLRAGPVQSAGPGGRGCWTTSAANPRRCDRSTLRSLLGCFMFTGDDVFKTLGVLSGGERNRYALARMLVSPGEFSAAGRADEPPGHAREGCAAGGDRRSSPGQCSSSRTTATSSTAWRKRYSRSRGTPTIRRRARGSTSIRATMRITGGAKRAARRK